MGLGKPKAVLRSTFKECSNICDRQCDTVHCLRASPYKATILVIERATKPRTQRHPQVRALGEAVTTVILYNVLHLWAWTWTSSWRLTRALVSCGAGSKGLSAVAA